MIAKDLMNKDVQSIATTATVKEAAIKMTEAGIGSLMVVDNYKLAGIVTRDDIIHKVVAAGKSAEKLRVKDIMTKEVIMVSPADELDYIVDVMKKKKVKKLPVVEGDRLVGMLTTTDICNAQPKMIKDLADLLLLPREKKIVAG